MRRKMLTVFVAGIVLPLATMATVIGAASLAGHPIDWTVPDAVVLIGRFILGVLGGTVAGWLLAGWFPDLSRRLLGS